MLKALVLILGLMLVMSSPVSALSSRSSSSRSSSMSSSRSSSSSRSQSRPKVSTPKSQSSSSKSTSSKTKTSNTKTKTSSKNVSSTKRPKTGVSTKKPGSTIKTKDGKTVKSSNKKPSNKRYSKSKGIVGDNGYSPRFRGGYSAPPGSVVYYESHSALAYLPWIYLFPQSSPRNDSATVVQPDGKEVKAEPVKEGTDGLVIVNWIILFILGVAGVVGIVYLVNRFTGGKNETI